MLEYVFRGLLLAVPAAIVAPYFGATSTVTFFLCALAIIPLAKYIGEATEELATRTSPAVGGLLNAAFGNAPELIIGFFALRAGLLDLVKASITGSIIGNLLFVLGVSMFVGGWGRDKQTFNRTAALASGSMLFLVAIALIIPALFLYSEPNAGARMIGTLSVGVSVALLFMYAASLLFTLRTHKHLYIEEVATFEPQWSVRKSVLVLALSAVAVSWISDLLVESVKPLLLELGWSQLFLGVIVIAIIGNAAEHFSAVLVARRNRMDLSLQIAIGSATQIATVVAPVLVLTSLFFPQVMSLVFEPFELISIVLSVLIVNLVVADGESNWLEGLQLLSAYAIMGFAFFFHS